MTGILLLAREWVVMPAAEYGLVGVIVDKSAISTKTVSLEASTPQGPMSLESILFTEELRSRPWRPPDFKKENRAR